MWPGLTAGNQPIDFSQVGVCDRSKGWLITNEAHGRRDRSKIIDPMQVIVVLDRHAKPHVRPTNPPILRQIARDPTSPLG